MCRVCSERGQQTSGTRVGGALLDRTLDEKQRGQDRSAGQVQLAEFSRHKQRFIN